VKTTITNATYSPETVKGTLQDWNTAGTLSPHMGLIQENFHAKGPPHLSLGSCWSVDSPACDTQQTPTWHSKLSAIEFREFSFWSSLYILVTSPLSDV
jgi:hypothetical protein